MLFRRPWSRIVVAPGLAILASASPAWAAAGAPHLDGASLGLLSVAPFAGLLLSIAILPLIAPQLWHHHYGKIAAGWAVLALIPIAGSGGLPVAAYEVLHVALLDYVPFIILLTTLYTVTGGIRVSGALVGTPASNTGILAIGTVLAGFMGTTGASMLLIRPLLAANERRAHKIHVFVFFIFLVSNIGGATTPLGDPPLFLGFLRGIDFFWPTVHLALPTALVSLLLLALFFAIDTLFFRRDGGAAAAIDDVEPGPRGIALDGRLNILLLAGVLAAVLASGSIDLAAPVDMLGLAIDPDGLLRDLVLVAICFLSLRLTAPAVREANSFTWEPMAEVARLFAAIFITIIAPLAILKAGFDGALSGVMRLLTVAGKPVDAMYFWITGALSGFLDNAPTYLVFYNAAGGDAQELMGPLASTLTAISAGAVFMGALSYIGNAPNLMVKSVVESHGVRMPSFFGYMAWSVGILVPIFLLVTVVFFR